MLDDITPLIITYNEAANIGRTLDKLKWAKTVMVIDSGSTDGTLKILKRYPQVKIIEHPFTDFARQCNYGLAQIATPWVLSLDADYELSDALVREIGGLDLTGPIAGYQACFVYRSCGRPLRGALYPPRTVLYRKKGAAYRNVGHGHRVAVDGKVAPLAGVIYHDDRKTLARWWAAQLRYTREEAEYLLASARGALCRADRIRLMAWPAPFAALLYVLFVKRCILDGWPGWYYALQRLIAETMLALEILDRRLRDREISAAEEMGNADTPISGAAELEPSTVVSREKTWP